ncbi:MAG: hypothetical protein M9887_02270 [Chitinophagales bacterium]|nr:hypothetical protein [Chitinophagales bacterium]
MLSTTVHTEQDALLVINTEEELLQWLTTQVEEMVSHDFDGLIQLLYRIDVDERKLKALIAENNAFESNRVIAKMILERQKQKVFWRNKFKSNQNEDDDEGAAIW